jgi:curved DNA-binding protein CbpA
MKRLTEQNYYHLLGVSPKASLEDVRSAYDEAVSIYSNDSIPTYSLFTQEEREQILARLVDAYKTLTNSQLRKEYNKILIEKGELSPQEIGFSSLEEPAVPKAKLREVSVESLTQEKKAENLNQTYDSTLDLFNGYTSVTGKSIKMVRLAREMSLEEVYRKTNIPKQTLENIEEEHFEKLPALVYLKGFLKAYADTLTVNQAQMVDGYVRRFMEWKTTGQK